MTDEKTDQLPLAVAYVRAGLALVSIPRGRKGPIDKRWQLESSAIRDEQQATKLNDCNIGIAHRWCGTCSVDVDNIQKAYDWLYAQGFDLFDLLNAGDAVQIKSGIPNRAKLLYRLPNGVQWLPTVKPHGDCLELRCASKDGTATLQDVLPPSIHPGTGKPYKWAGAGDWRHLPTLPYGLLKLWQSLSSPQKLARQDALPLTTIGHLERVQVGGRNNRLTSLAGTMRVRGMSRAAISAALLVENAEKCDPPLPATEVEIIAGSVARYEPATPTVRAPIVPFQLTHISELLKTPEPLKWLISEHLLPESTALLFGAPAAGKSLLCVDWVACIATGRPWNGYTVKSGLVIYLAGEGHHGIRRRFKAWGIHNNAELELDCSNIVVSERGGNMDTQEGFEEVCAAVAVVAEKYGDPVLIVVDTLHRNMAGDENAAKDMSAYFRNTDYLRARYKTTILTVHHSGHADSGRARGSSSIKAAVDTEFSVEDRGGVRTLTATKQKDGRLPVRTAFELEVVPLSWLDASGKEETSVVLKAAITPTSKGKVMPRGVRFALEAFQSAAQKHVRISNDRCIVSLEPWRSEFNKTHTGDSDEAKKKAFQRARKDLQSANAIGVQGNDYWLTPDTAIWSDMSEVCSTKPLDTGESAGHKRDNGGTCPLNHSAGVGTSEDTLRKECPAVPPG